MKPTEGTILTVIRKAAEAAEQIATSNNDAWAVCCAAMAAAEEALAKTPEQLPVLKKAGVVDAGGQGLVLIFQGMGAVLEKGTVCSPLPAAPSRRYKPRTKAPWPPPPVKLNLATARNF